MKKLKMLYWLECCKKKSCYTIDSWANNAADDSETQMLNELSKVFMLKKGIVETNKELWDEAIKLLEKQQH